MNRWSLVVVVVAVMGCKDKAKPPPAPGTVDGCAGYAKVTTKCSGEDPEFESVATSSCSQFLAERAADDPTANSLRIQIGCARGGAATCEEFGECSAKINPLQ